MDVTTGQNYINGQWRESTSGRYISVINPATEELVARAPDSVQSDVQDAVRAARAAWEAWRWVNPFARAAHLHEIGKEVSSAEQAMACAITREMGKPLGEALGEVRKLAKAFHYYAEEAKRTTGTIIPNEEDGYTSLVQKEPIGVVAAVSPWNYPVELIGWKLAASLAAGCTIVVKPSEYSPSAAIEIFRCIERSKLPAGVANLVTGAGEAGRALVMHRDINKVAFTGSEATGAAIAKAVNGVKPMSMELGGSCPIIVTESADVDAAVAGTLRRSFRNAGQICIAINRAYVHDSQYEEFMARLVKAVTGMVVADGMDMPDADMGPVSNKVILEKVHRHVEDARDKGARVLCGGGPLPGRTRGYFYSPTVLADCTQEMLVMHKETFGPVVGIAPFTHLEEAIEKANGTDAGLAAYVYASDVRETFLLARRLDFGNVSVNNVDAGIMNAPYGGRKGSGYGYEHGREGLEGYLQLKHVRLHHGA